MGANFQSEVELPGEDTVGILISWNAFCVNRNPVKWLPFGIQANPDILPVSQLTENIVYQTHITRFSVLSKPEIHSRYTHPKIGRKHLEIRLLIVKVSFTILDIFGVARTIGL